MSAWQFEDVAPLAVEANGHLPLPLCDWTPEELAKVAAFETAPTPPEVREAAVVEEVARALYDADQAYAEETDYDFHQPVEWRYNHPAHDDFRRFAAAAVAAYRATQDGGAEEAVRRVEKVVRCGRGYTDAEHWVDGYYACPGFASPALAPQAGDGAR